ncbi:MAG: PLDc N-terminal domain-containing protein [Armatimonadota bacterium]
MNAKAIVITIALLLCVGVMPAAAQTSGAHEGTQELAPLLFVVPMMLFWGIYMLMIPLIILLNLASWIVAGLAIYDCILRDFEQRSNQAVWCLLIFLTRWIGALIYYFVVYRPNTPPRAA